MSGTLSAQMTIDSLKENIKALKEDIEALKKERDELEAANAKLAMLIEDLKEAQVRTDDDSTWWLVDGHIRNPETADTQAWLREHDRTVREDVCKHIEEYWIPMYDEEFFPEIDMGLNFTQKSNWSGRVMRDMLPRIRDSILALNEEKD